MKTVNDMRPEVISPMRLHILVIMVVLIFGVLAGCTRNADVTPEKDETGKRVKIGLVNADPVYLVSVESRVEDVVSYMRSMYSVFFQPTPEQILALNYVSLAREIKKVGFKQPGMEPDQGEIDALVYEKMLEDAGIYLSKFNSGETMEDVAKEFSLNPPSERQIITIGETPDWDQVLLETEPGEYSKPAPVRINNFGYIFKVFDKGKMDDGTEWVEAQIFAFPLRTNEVEQIVKDRMAKEWDVSLTNGFFKAVYQYYSGDVESAYSTLISYTQNDGSRDALAQYFIAKILMMKNDIAPDQELIEKAIGHLKKAIELNESATLGPHYMLDLAKIYFKQDNESEGMSVLRSAIENVRDDLYLTRELADLIDQKGDDEYLQIAKSKINDMEEQIRSEIISKERVVERKGRVMTGEGYLFEDNDEIIDEMKNAIETEQKFDFTKIELKE